MTCHITASIGWLTSVGFNNWGSLELGTSSTHLNGTIAGRDSAADGAFRNFIQPTQFNISKKGMVRGR